mgnify:CR=1 FL=1
MSHSITFFKGKFIFIIAGLVDYCIASAGTPSLSKHCSIPLLYHILDIFVLYASISVYSDHQMGTVQPSVPEAQLSSL